MAVSVNYGRRADPLILSRIWRFYTLQRLAFIFVSITIVSVIALDPQRWMDAVNFSCHRSLQHPVQLMLVQRSSADYDGPVKIQATDCNRLKRFTFENIKGAKTQSFRFFSTNYFPNKHSASVSESSKAGGESGATGKKGNFSAQRVF